MNLDSLLFLVLDWLIMFAARIAANVAFVMLCLCAVVICALTYWSRRTRTAEDGEDVGLRGFRWEEGDEPY